MNGFSAWLEQLQYERLLDLVVTVAAALLCITIHETCHGWAAYRLGDPTAKQAGRLTLNPLRHIDLLGLVCMAVAHFGWAKPVPINPGNFRHFRRDTAITALAGPLSNLVLAVLLITGVLDGPMRFLLDKLLTVLLQICRWPMALLNAPVYGR